MAAQKLLVWVQTSKHRDPSPTLQSIEASDIGASYFRAHDEHDWPDLSLLQAWWRTQWLNMVEHAKLQGANLVLRLEDDIIVNRHIVHNVLSWPAFRNPDFGYGTLFCPDYWELADELTKTNSGEFIRTRDYTEGAQGQLLKVDHIEATIQRTEGVLVRNGQKIPLSFDWSISKAAALLGNKTYVHVPSLVNVTESSLRSTLSKHLPTDSPLSHYWGHKRFAPRWRRPVEPLPAGLESEAKFSRFPRS